MNTSIGKFSVTHSTAARQPLVVAFIAPILSDGELANYPAASPSGNRFQHGVLNALLAHGIDTSVISLRAVSSYPRSRRLFFRGADGALSEGVPYRQIGFINVGPLKTLTAAFTSFLAIRRWARQHRGKRRVMLFYNACNPSAWVGIATAWLTGSKVIAIIADVRVPGSGGDASLLRRMEYQIAVASLPRMDAIVSVTNSIAADFAAGVPFLLLDGGVPDDMLAPLPAPALRRAHTGGPDSNTFVVLYAGGLTRLAGVPLLLEAFRRLDHPRFRLWITGDGELEPVVRHAAAVDTRIQYFGKLSRRDLLSRYTSADVLVNPHSTVLLTARYVFPSKLLEYLATGLPVITTATPEIAAEYGDLCTVLDREEPQALADAIMQVAGVPAAERLKHSRAARLAVIERRAWKRQGCRLVQFLEEHVPGGAGYGHNSRLDTDEESELVHEQTI